MGKGGAVCAGGYGASDGLDIDRSEVWKHEAMLGEVGVELVQRDAGFEGDDARRGDGPNTRKVVEVDEPGGSTG